MRCCKCGETLLLYRYKCVATYMKKKYITSNTHSVFKYNQCNIIYIF